MSDIISKSIALLVKNILNEASKRVSERFDISIEEAMEIWDDLQCDIDSLCPKGVTPKSGTSENSEKSKKSSKPKKEGYTCVHILTRGPNKNSPCGKSSSKESQTGNYCTLHIGQENKAQPNVPKKPLKEAKDLKIMKDPNYGRYIHSKTGFVFKSPTEKIVIGVQNNTGDVRKLTGDDIKECKSYRFVFDPKCVETDEDDDGEDDEDEEETDEEKEEEKKTEKELSTPNKSEEKKDNKTTTTTTTTIIKNNTASDSDEDSEDSDEDDDSDEDSHESDEDSDESD